MGRTTQRLAAAGIASSVLLSGSWVMAAQAANAPDPACAEAIRLTEEMANVNGQRIGTMAARSAAMQLGMDDRAASLAPKHAALVAEYQRLHVAFRVSAADCR